MAGIEEKVRKSWADQVEQGEKLPPPTESTIGNSKVVTEYKINVEGKKVKVNRYYKSEKQLLSKNVAARKAWKKYGAAAHDPPGPNPANTFISEEIFMQFLNKKEENASTDDFLAKFKERKIKCRICTDEHWTTQCPYKDNFGSMSPFTKKEAKTSTVVTNSQTEAKVKVGKYIPPNMREGGNKRGESMNTRMRDEIATVRVTNLPEEILESELQDLFRPFGAVSRIYLAKNKSTGLSKGFAFVSFRRRDDAEQAIFAMNGFGYENLILNVEWAKPSVAH